MNDGNAWQSPFKAGDRLLKFDIRGVIGQGGQAIVYEGWDDFLKRRVAIKIVTDPAPDLARRAQAEAQVLCDLHHPNIVHVFDAGFLDGRMIYIVMELLAGRTFREVLWQLQRLSVVEALTIGAQIADGVHVAHCRAEPVIHRDLKPENVFILPGNSPKILDFGIAKFVARKDMTTQRNVRRGTVGYMSPEQLQGLEVTPSTDVYALGTILYEAISGFRPCEIGKTEPTPESSMWHQLSSMPPQLDRFVPGVSKEVGSAIQRMLAKDPAKRFSSMTEVGEILRAERFRIVEGVGKDPAYEMRRLWDTTAFPPPARRVADPFIAQTEPTVMVHTDQTTARAMQPVPALAPDTPPSSPPTGQTENTLQPVEVARGTPLQAGRVMCPTVEQRPAAPPVAPAVWSTPAPASNTLPGLPAISPPENVRQPIEVPWPAPQAKRVVRPTVEQLPATPPVLGPRVSAQQVVTAALRRIENKGSESAPKTSRQVTAQKSRPTPATRPVTVISSTAAARVQEGRLRLHTAAVAMGASAAVAFGIATYSVRLFDKLTAKPAEAARVTSAASASSVSSVRPASTTPPSLAMPSAPEPISEPSPSVTAAKPKPPATPRAPRNVSKSDDHFPELGASHKAWFFDVPKEEPHPAKPKASSTPKAAASVSSAPRPRLIISPEPERPRLWLKPR